MAVRITPDQSKVLILVIKDNEKKVKVFNLQDLSQLCEYVISNDIGKSQLFVEPYGRYLLTQNFNDDSVIAISNLKTNPIFKSIIPNNGSINDGTRFEIDGFIDLSRFSKNIKVCFRNNNFCASSVSVSDMEKKLQELHQSLYL